MAKRLTTEQFITRAIGVHGNRYGYTDVIYTGSNDSVIINCSIHGQFVQRASKHLSGSGCNQCGQANRKVKMHTTVSKKIDGVLQKFHGIHGDRYGYDSIEYHGGQIPVTIVCHIHGEFRMTPAAHIHKKRGCPHCTTGYYKKKTTSEFIADCHKVHGKRYDYGQVNYTGANGKITIGCNIHGNFIQTSREHSGGANCPSCVGGSVKPFLYYYAKFVETHGLLYAYDEPSFVNTKIPIRIKCSIHGWFSQHVTSHINGANCPECSGIGVKSDTYYINQFRETHGTTYDYGDRIDKDWNIKCSTHGWFVQNIHSHINGHGCNMCTHRISKPSQTWLDSLGIPDDSEHREVTKLVDRYTVDGYDPDTNTVYEFQGDYWHGNPDVYESDQMNKSVGKTHGELYKKTIEKNTRFIDAGFNYVEIWESEWNALTSNIS